MVEDVLVPDLGEALVENAECLNPCCGGRCSSTINRRTRGGAYRVLILVVVEDVLVHTTASI